MRISDWSSDVCSSDLITPDQHIAAITIDIAHAVGIVGIVTGDDVSRKDMPESGARSIIGDPDKRRLLLLHGELHQYIAPDPLRTDERRVGNECVSPCRYRCTRYLEKNTKNKKK